MTKHQAILNTPSQLSSVYGAKVIARYRNQTLEVTNKGHYCVTDGWLSDWITFYDGPWVWAHDGTINISKRLREKLNAIAEAREVQ